MIRRAARWLTPIVAMAATLLGPAAPALAQIPNPLGGISDAAQCKSAPDPQTPDGGMSGVVVDSGGLAYADPNATVDPDVAPTGRDPFDPSAQTSVYREYGFGGLSWTTYDLGCLGTATSYPMNTAANTIERLPIFMTGLSETITRALQHPTFLGVFDPLIKNTADGISPTFRQLLPVVLAVACIWILWSIRRGHLGEGMRAAGWMLAILAVSMLLLTAPVHSVRVLDNGLGQMTGAMDQAFGDYQTQVGQIHQEMLYRTWLAGTFGDADSPTAKQYGPDLFKASAYSWSEMKEIEANGDRAGEIKEAKQQLYKDTAAKVAEADPVAYEHLTGAHTDNRMWRAVFTTIGVAAATFFQLLAGISAILAFIAIRLFVLAFPIVALLAFIPSQRQRVLDLTSYLTGRLIAAIFLLFVARLTSVMIGAILGTHGLPGWLTVGLLVGVVVGAWKLCRAHRNVPGQHHMNRLLSKIGLAAVGYEVAKEAVDHGVREAIEHERDNQPAPGFVAAPPAADDEALRVQTRVRVNVTTPAAPVAPGPAVSSGAPALDPGPTPAPSRGRGPVLDAEETTDPDGRTVYRVTPRPRSGRPEVDADA